MLRRIGIASACLLGLLLALAAGAFGLAQTRWAQDRIATLLAGALGTADAPAEVTGLSGFLPFDMRLAQLRLRDAEGVWLEVADARLTLRPAALLHGEIAVEHLGAALVALERLPASPPDAEPTRPFTLPELPDLPTALPRVAVERLQVDRLEVGAPVLGERATFALDGTAGTSPDGAVAQARLELRRTDAPTARLELDAGLDLRAGTLALDLEGSETGGLLAAATGRPEAGALRLSLKGDGPLAGWQGRLAVEAERLAALNLDIELAYGARKHLGLAGSLDAAPGALPTELAAVVGRRAELALQAGQAGPQRYALEALELRLDGLALQGSGSADLAADTVTGAATLRAPDLARFAGLAGTPLAGAATLELTAKGAARQPELELALTGTGLRAAEIALDRLGGGIGLSFDAPLGDGPVGLEAAGTITVDGVALAGRQLADGRLELALDAALPARGDAVVRTLALRSALGEVTGRASIDRDRLAGTARVDLRVPELKAVMLALESGLPLAGTVDLGADVTLAEDARRIGLDLAGKATGFAGLPPGAQELVGAAPTLAAKATVEPGHLVAVDSLALAGAGIRLEGDPHLDLAETALGGTLRLLVPELARLEPALGQPVAGALDLRAVLGGTVELPTVTLDGAVERPAVAGERFDRATLGGEVKGPLDTPSGSVLLGLLRGRQEVALATGFALAGDLLKLTGLTLNAPATRLAGEAEVALARPLVRGRLSGEARDLAALRAWTGQAIAGKAKLDLRLTTPQDRQDATLKLDAGDVRGDFGSLRSAALALTVSDALGRGGLDGSLRAQGFASGDTRIANATLGVGGRLAAIDLTASVTGDQAGQPIDLAAAAGLDVLGPRKTIRATKLAGKIGGESVRLVEPATVTLDGPAIAVDRLALDLGPGKVRGKLDLGATRVAGELSLAKLSLATLERFGAPPLAGTAEATLTLAGTRAAPEVTLDAGIAKAALDPAAKLRLDGKLAGSLRGGRLTADLALSGLGATPLAARVALPATFGLAPPAFALNDTAALDGRIAGPIDLARLAQLAPLGGTQLAGTLQVALDLAGSLRQPGLGGTLDLAGGSVQDVASGVVLRGLTLRARAAADRLTIEQLSATDPTGGTLQGKGAVRLLAGGQVGYDVQIDANKARVLDNTLGNVFLSGTLGATGDLARAQVRGNLTVDRADLQIPDSTGPSVPVIAVKEVNRTGGTAAAPAATAPATPFAVGFAIDVDIPGRLFVRGRGLDSEWNGKLTLRGDLADPLVEGELDVRRGYFDLLDRRFTIDRGALDFVGSRPPVPMIDLAATASTVEVTVTVALQGPAADPKITLTSEPTLPQDEILARLLFGTSASRITPMQGIRLAAAVQELQGGGTLSGALSKFRRAVGLDTLDLRSTETTDESGETNQQTSARVGKYVTDKVYLEVEQGVTDGGSKARVQVDLTPNLSVGSTVNDQSQTGVGLQWRYDY